MHRVRRWKIYAAAVSAMIALGCSEEGRSATDDIATGHQTLTAAPAEAPSNVEAAQPAPASAGPAALTATAPLCNNSMISAGGDFTCASQRAGSLSCWGNNFDGQLGIGGNSPQALPATVTSIATAVQIATGDDHGCAVLRSGAIKCWGDNSFGRLGDGTLTTRRTPVSVTGISNAIQVSAGSNHTCALLSDGTIKCWGANTSGQLGNNSILPSTTPVSVSGLQARAVQIDAGDEFTCATLVDKRVACWGQGLLGQLGNGSILNRLRPVLVSNLSDATEVSAGSGFACAARASGAVACWGRNDNGRLGNNSLFGSNVPVAVSALNNAAHVSAGSGHACAVKTTTDVVCWGANLGGQLGDGTRFDRRTPVALAGLSDVVQVSAGSLHTCAMKAFGNLACWGTNLLGRLGDGTTTDRLTPTAIAGGSCPTTLVDSDCDDIPDSVEASLGLDPTQPADGDADPDGDGVPTAEELRIGGNPSSADTDGDGVADGTDLISEFDLDGDGRPASRDNCPERVNAAQLNADGDVVGDACDGTPVAGVRVALTTLELARHTLTGQYALIPVGQVTRRPDQVGFLGTGTTFRVARDATANATRIEELYHQALGQHAYVQSATERASLLAAGFSSLGSIGAGSTSAFAFGSSTLLRRFVKGAGASRSEAVTTSASQASELLAAGYSEVANLGYAIVDEGHYSGPRSVVRYRRSGATLHSVLRTSETGLNTYASEGPKFKLFPEVTGAMTALYRLRKADGSEALSTQSSELSALTAAGYVREGVLGYVYTSASAQALEPLVPLYRLTGPSKPYEHTASAQELATLRGQGYTTAVVLGYVAQISTQEAQSQTCLGAKPPYDRITEGLRGVPPGPRRDAMALIGLTTSCAIERALTGQAANPAEQALAAQYASLDAQTRAELLTAVTSMHQLSPAQRQALLGSAAHLDPGDCSTAPAAAEIQDFLLYATGAGAGFAGGPNLYTLRAPQCQGGTNIAPRSITTVEQVCVSNCGPGQEFPEFDNSLVKPQLYGIRKSGDVAFGAPPAATQPPLAPGAFVENWAAEHQAAGLPLVGINTGVACNDSNPCNAQLGQLCVRSTCRAYPIVRPNSKPTFTGASLWDRVGRIRFTRYDDPNDVRTFASAVTPFINPAVNNDLRCDRDPTPQNAALSSSVDCGPGRDCEGARPGEQWLDTAQVIAMEADGTQYQEFNLDSGHFYRVQAVNQNGDYFVFGEPVPLDLVERDAQGRTIHVCDDTRCSLPPSSTDAACLDAVVDAPVCGGGIGGVWLTPPRPLANCRGPLFNEVCPETPDEFVSDAEYVAGTEATPLLIYVSDPQQKQFLNTKITAARCFDETGVDWGGEDELVVQLVGLGNTFAPGDVADHVNAGSTFATGIDSQDNDDTNFEKVNDRWNSSIPLRVTDENAEFVLQVGEDDDAVAQTIIASVVGGGLTFLAGYYGGAAAGTGTGVIAGGIIVSIATTDPDDFIGQRAWATSVVDVTTRGNQTHDINWTTVVPVMTRLTQFERDLRTPDPTVSAHPTVDVRVFASNDQLPAMSCPDDAACGAGKRCVIGVCAPLTWTDQSAAQAAALPLQTGHIEVSGFKGEGTNYQIYISTSLSQRDAIANP